MNNPFEPDDVAPADPWSDSTPVDTTPSTPTKEAPVTNQVDSEVSVTLKQHGGFDSPWIVVRGGSAAEVKQQLRDLFTEDLITAVAETAKKFTGTAPAGAGQQNSGGQRRGGGNGGGQQNNTLPPGVEPRSCKHGDMVFHTGNGKKGPYKAFFCPTEQGDPDKCRPIFL